MIYFCDDYNFQEKNFKALYAWIKQNNIAVDYNKDYSALKQRWGDYAEDFYGELINADEIANENYCGYGLYDIYEQELLYACASSENWGQLDDLPIDKDELIQFLYYEFTEIFNLCRAAAKYWIDYWHKAIPSQVKLGVGFGGSLIYVSAFAKVLSARNVPCIFLEHFFTGNDYYCEKRIDPLPNNSILKSNNYCEYISSKSHDPVSKYLKLYKAKNKNVIQPAYGVLQRSDYCLILGQVMNDFSVLSRNNPLKNSITFYKKTIDILLETTDLDIVIKTHPYERKKVKPGAMTTYEVLNFYVQQKSENQRTRIQIVENISLAGLIDNSRFALTLNSQSGMEALLRCKPLISFGKPFYGHKGFSVDLSPEHLNDLSNETDKILLSIDQFEKFQKFMDIAFEHLVGDGETNKINEIMGGIINLKIQPVVKPSAIKAITPKKELSKKNENISWLRLRYKRCRKVLREFKKKVQSKFHKSAN